MVEFALVGPLLLLLLFMIAEAALYVNAVATIDNAAREGARVAAICGSTGSSVTVGNTVSTDCDSAVQGAIISHLGILPSGGNALQVSPYPGPQPAGSTITITATYRYQYYLELFLGTGPTTNIVSTATVVSQQ